MNWAKETTWLKHGSRSTRVLSHLRRGVRVLADHGIKSIVLVADHGHLFGEDIGEDMKIDAPGGQG